MKTLSLTVAKLLTRKKYLKSRPNFMDKVSDKKCWYL